MMCVVCTFQLTCATSLRKRIKCCFFLFLSHRPLMMPFCMMCVFVSACVRAGQVQASEPRRKSRRILEFWL